MFDTLSNCDCEEHRYWHSRSYGVTPKHEKAKSFTEKVNGVGEISDYMADTTAVI